MLINCDTKTIIYTPFKNYSTSLHEYFGDLDGWEEFVGIHPRIDGDCYDCDPNYNITYKHTNKPPSAYPLSHSFLEVLNIQQLFQQLEFTRMILLLEPKT
jgi:hypothetical protein